MRTCATPTSSITQPVIATAPCAPVVDCAGVSTWPTGAVVVPVCCVTVNVTGMVVLP